MIPTVSIIMPAYNAENYIKESISSVIAQTFQDWELIIIDDCSTDDTPTIISNFISQDSRIKSIRLYKNSGKPSVAKNHGLKMIKGDFIAFIDSDDLWISDKLAKQVALMQNDNEIALSYTGGYWIDDNGKIVKDFVPKYSCGFNLKRQLSRYEINNQSVMITKKALQNTLMQFNENILIGEDFNLFMHIVAKYKSSTIPQQLIKYRIHNNAITKSKKQVSDGILLTLNELNIKYNIYLKYPLKSLITYFKAIRFKYIKKNWK